MIKLGQKQKISLKVRTSTYTLGIPIITSSGFRGIK